MAKQQTEHSSDDKSREAEQAKGLPLRPGVHSGMVDVVGKRDKDIHIDPEITEGHPGYEESGSSEIIPPKRFAGPKTHDKSIEDAADDQ
ncbi:hypothetical protein GC197_00040 [bacterium]|nr:hypothetical protein [bacterium]